MKVISALLFLFALWPGAAVADSYRDGFAEFRASLSESERARVLRAFSDVDRKAYRLTPGSRGGLSLGSMDRDTRAAAFRFLRSTLSERGIAVVQAAIDREARLGELEGKPDYRDPDNFYLAVFGTPGEGNWGFRFEGHHLSLNVTGSGERLAAVTPWLLGANPRALPSGTPDPLAPFLDAHDQPQVFLQEVARMFKGQRAIELLRKGRVDNRGFGLWGHPHMKVNAESDFGATVKAPAGDAPS